MRLSLDDLGLSDNSTGQSLFTVPRKSYRRKLLTLGVVLILVLGIVFWFWGRSYFFGSPYDSPEKTVNAYLDGLGDMDSEKMLDCYEDQSGPLYESIRTFTESMIDTYKVILEEQDISLSIIDRDIDVVLQTNNTAVVNAEYTIGYSPSDLIQNETTTDVFYLVKSDGKWLLTDSSYASVSSG